MSESKTDWGDLVDIRVMHNIETTGASNDKTDWGNLHDILVLHNIETIKLIFKHK